MFEWTGAAVELILLLVVLATGASVLMLVVECFASLLPSPRMSAQAGRRGNCCVLVPAHNEEGLLRQALESLGAQLQSGDRLLVVAHNCTDATQEIARRNGAEVLVVNDSGDGGKAAAVRAGLQHLAPNPPEVVVLVDADCTVEPGALDALVRAVAYFGGPVQGAYAFAPRKGEDEIASISSLSLLVKNLVRPLGLHRLGLNCQLMGSGCAFPFETLHVVPLGEGSIAEDSQLAVDLARRGHATHFCPAARITSRLPLTRKVARIQRRRWEHGHLELILYECPRLLLASLRKGDLALFTLALDIAIPPLSLWLLAWGSTTAAALLLAAINGHFLALGLALGSGALLLSSLLACWLRFLGPVATLRACLRVPRYVIWKLPLLLDFVRNRERAWRKTPR